MRWLILVLIRLYQRWFSRFTPSCPGTPSCSQYAIEMVELHGARAGLQLAMDRIQRCE